MVTGELFAYTRNRWPYAVLDDAPAPNVTIEKWSPLTAIVLSDDDDDDYGWK